jgi:hypothetical protein
MDERDATILRHERTATLLNTLAAKAYRAFDFTKGDELAKRSDEHRSLAVVGRAYRFRDWANAQGVECSKYI